MSASYVNSWRPSREVQACVYAAVHSTSGSIYIGCTSKSILARRGRHNRCAQRGRSKFSLAIRDCGIEAFHFFVICEADSFASALVAEGDLIKVWNPDLNMTTGGLGCPGFRHTDKSREKMRAWRAAHPEHRPALGKRRPDNAPRLRSLMSGVTPWNKGRAATDAERARLSESHRGPLNRPLTQPELAQRQAALRCAVAAKAKRFAEAKV